MSKAGSALDRLDKLMHGNSPDQIPSSSISSDDYVNDLEDDIMSKMTVFEEVELDDNDTSETSLEDTMINDPVMSNVISDEENTVIEQSTTENTNNTEEIVSSEPITENISIDVTDTGNDIPFEQPSNEELFNNNTEITQPKPEGKRRGRKRKHEEELKMPKVMDDKVAVTTPKDSNSNPLYDQLIVNMIEELKRKKFKFSGFNEESMEILYDYILKKF